MKYFVIGMFMVVVGAVLVTRDSTKAQAVYDVCNQSRISVGINETQCADLQVKYGIEFLCEQANRSVDNHCWTEPNKELE